MKQLIIDGILIEINKKKMKNMYLRVLPPEGSVHVSAPLRMSDEAIKKFVLSKMDWIILQQGKIQKQHTPANLNYVSGEEVYLWGNRYILEIVYTSHRGKVLMEGNHLLLQIREVSTIEQRASILNAWYREALKEKIPVLIEKWEKIIGVKAEDWSIRDMKTRWGTCNVRSKHICLNLALVKKPQHLLEYVVVHELVHLLEGSHNSIFKGFMDRFLPDWRNRKAELNGKRILDSVNY